MEIHYQLDSFLNTKFGANKLTRLTGWSRSTRYSNRYILNDILSGFLISGLLTVEEVQPFITSEIVKNIACTNADNTMVIFKKIFKKSRDLKLLIDNVHNFSQEVQNYLFDNYITEKHIDEMEFQNYMWSSDRYTKNLIMLYNRGLISIENISFKRRINLSYMRGSELDFLFETYQNKKIDKKFYSETFKTQVKHGLHAYCYFEKLQKWSGFIKAIPGEFLIEYHYDKKIKNKNYDVFNALLYNKKIDKKNIEYLSEKYKNALIKFEEDKKRKKELQILKDNTEYSKICAIFKKHGVNVDKPQHEEWNGGDRYTFATNVEGYEHTMYIMKHSFMDFDTYSSQVKSEVRDHKEMLKKYVKTVHAEMDRIRSLGIECTHVMEGGGAQMQAFFCDSKGYICIMYLGMKGEPAAEDYTCHIQSNSAFNITSADPFSEETFYEGKTIDVI